MITATCNHVINDLDLDRMVPKDLHKRVPKDLDPTAVP